MATKCPKCRTDNPDTQRFCGECGTQLLHSEKPSTGTLTLGVPAKKLSLGSIFAGRYQIIEELGKGGMGKLFRALDLKLQEEVALKIIKPEIASDKETIDRFSNELKLARRISHKNVGRMYELMEDEETHYITMEYIAGQDLKGLIRQSGRLTLETALSIAKQVGEGLAEAHRLGVVHRDLKPNNILIDRDGTAKILDFGIARSLQAKGITVQGMIIGTLGYMSPEQVEGREIDARSDIFAFGCLLYEMLTGKSAFGRETTAETIAAVLHDDPPPLSESGIDIPEELQRVINRCLEKDPERRFPSMNDIPSLLTRAEKSVTKQEKETREAAIAVLPFVNMSSDPENEYFSDGLAEELINSLSKIEGLHVVSRTSSFSFKGRNQDIRQIAEKLNVGTVLEGSVRKSGNRLRITAQLIKASNGFHLYAETFDRELKDIFEIQNEIAHSIAKVLRVVLTSQDKISLSQFPTASIEAFDYCLRGRQFFYLFQRTGFERAIKLFLHAIEVDPGYASAYAWAANCYSFLYTWFNPSPENIDAAEKSSLKALELNPELAEGHVARGMVLANRKEYEGAREEFERALRLKPDLFEASYLYARLSFAQGQFEKAARLAHQAGRLRPEDYNAPCLQGMIYTELNKPAEREQAYRKTLENVKRSLEFFPEDTRALYMGATAAISLGDEKLGLEWAERISSAHPQETMTLYGVACAYALVGQTEKAIALMEEAVQFGTIQKKWLEHDPDLRSIRDHPRFKALLERL
ncbi:MAG TPA: protein kinase [Candidatus Desulfaltia sp.]|nr:protein kinase [Candidatus Desulfaltia sp.]